MKLDVPIIETPRLRLRAPEAEDWEPFAAFAGSERTTFIGGPIDREKAWRAFGHVIGHWVLRGFGSFVITRRGAGPPLGLAGPWYPEGWPEREIGWTLWTPEAEGRGYAFEAAEATLAHAFRSLGWGTAVSYIARGNARSIALAERLGAVLDPDAAHKDAGDLVYRHPVPEALP